MKNRRIILFGIAGIFLSQLALAEIPSFQMVRSKLSPSDYRLYDRSGALIHEQRKDLKVRQLEWVPLSEISPALRDAVLLSEDRRFLNHNGVDWLALTEAAGKFLLGSSKRGASTISMQVAGLLDTRLKPKRVRREWRQKLNQVWQAIDLEKSWTKEQILEAYLNLISFRGELKGIPSAARGLFSKIPSGLNQEESLILAALIRSPQADDKKVAERACALAEAARVSDACPRLTALIEKQGLNPKPFAPAIALAPHVARVLSRENKDRTTLDRNLQRQVLEVLRRQVIALRERNMNDAAALVVDNKTGQVLAYIGSVGDLSSAFEVDGVKAKRQAGSTLKPFLYSLALEKRYLTASSLIDDSLSDIALGTGSVYRPKDFDNEYHGDDVTVRMALASSLNIPAVKTLQLVGVGAWVKQLQSLGFKDLRSEEFYGPSLALGTADISLWELVNAYRTLANRGRWGEISFDMTGPKLGASKQVISEDAAFIVSDILSDPSSRSLTFGLDSPMALRFWTAAKTGTSKDMRDNWCVGYSSRYTVGVWAGNFSGEPMRNVTGMSGAAPAWAEIMEILHRSGQDISPRPPRSLVRAENEWFVRGTEPNQIALESPSKPSHQARILYPVEGLMIARDPDIPEDRQRIFFESGRKESGHQWILNDRYLGPAASTFAWMPEDPGTYELKLVSASGQILDQVHFTVRR